MLSRHINTFLPWLNMAASPVQPVRCTSPASTFPADSPVRGEFRRAAVDRSGRTIRLTDAGEVWRQYPAGRYRNWGRVNGRFMMLPIDARIAAYRRHPHLYELLYRPLMADFYGRYPGITLQLQEMRRRKSKICFVATNWTLGLPSACAFAGAGGNSFTDRKFSVIVAQHHPLAVHEQVALSRLHMKNWSCSARNLPPESKLTTTRESGAASTGGN